MDEVSNGAEQDPVAQRQDAEIDRVLGAISFTATGEFVGDPADESQAVQRLKAAMDLAGYQDLASAIGESGAGKSGDKTKEWGERIKRRKGNPVYRSTIDALTPLFENIPVDEATGAGKYAREALVRRLRGAALKRGETNIDRRYVEPSQPAQQ